ncbi:MAG: hypothetical protein HY859_06755 [Caulobacterales bacterium]|nr:hypothetical protein [Caulobacterales bacterium]
MGNAALTEITVRLIQQTERGILVNDSDDPDNAVWLPKSQVEFVEKGGDLIEVTLPEWLAIERKLV